MPALVSLAIVLVAAVVIVVIAVQSCSTTTEREPEQEYALIAEGEQAVVTVEAGEGATEIAQSLADAGLISSVSSFVNLVTTQNAESSLIPGTYVFTGGSSQDYILSILMSGPASTGMVLTIPEGYTRERTADAVAQATEGAVSVEAFLDASADASVYAGEYPFLETAGSNSLEGFLFPKTYTLSVNDDATSIVRMMLDQFQIETSGLDWSYPESRGLNLYEAVNLASVVEKESSGAYYDTIASVFYNRLASDHPYLESDATTAYEVGHDPTADEVHADTPYSTYTHEGLPPTPICSPSFESIQAVCNPAETNYMFFYSPTDENGEVQFYFSETYEEHEEAIASS